MRPPRSSGGSSLGPLRETEMFSYGRRGGLDQSDPWLAVELRIASRVVSVAVGMCNEDAQFFPGSPFPLTDQLANDRWSGKRSASAVAPVSWTKTV